MLTRLATKFKPSQGRVQRGTWPDTGLLGAYDFWYACCKKQILCRTEVSTREYPDVCQLGLW